jgi:fucose 4-O-acetylase-like acetyltransferase
VSVKNVHPTPSAATPRSRLVDVARGLAIIGVVFNHAVDGLVGSGLIGTGSAVFQVNTGLYILRMPALLFLVGLFVPQGVRKHGAVAYIRRRASLLVYLYLLWQLLQGLVEIATAGVRNGSTTVLDILTVWSPIAHLWFLPFLVLATVVCVALRAWEGSAWRRALLASSVMVVALACWGWDVRLFGLNGSGLITFMVTGSMVGLRGVTRIDRLSTPWTIFALAVSGGFFAALLWSGLEPATVPGSGGLGERGRSVVGAAFGVAILLLLATLLSRLGVIAAVLSYIGRTTLPIYLAHVIVVAGCRVILDSLGAHPGLVLVIAVPAAVVVPLMLNRLSEHRLLRGLFHLPRLLERTSAAKPVARVARPRTHLDAGEDNQALSSKDC